jgi:hypothetical protein
MNCDVGPKIEPCRWIEMPPFFDKKMAMRADLTGHRFSLFQTCDVHALHFKSLNMGKPVVTLRVGGTWASK